MMVVWILVFSFAVMPGLEVVYSIYSILVVILISIYLLVDTQLILGGKSFQLDLDNYVFGSFILYIDIIAIFVRLVRNFGWW